MAPLAFLRNREIKIGWPRRPFVAVAAIGFSTLLLVTAAITPVWLPNIRRIIPDRYIEAYAPEPLRAVIFQRSSSAVALPAASAAESAGESAQQLLGNPPTSAPSNGASNPQATATPIFVLDPYASDNLPASYALSGFVHSYQAWNNCGPATLSTTLSYWGRDDSQMQVAGVVKPNPEDRNVRPDELAAYAEGAGFRAVVRVNGSLSLLKRLIASGFPPIIEQGFDVEKLGWMGHYTVLTAYSDEFENFTAQDSYLGPNRKYPYAHIEKYWAHFNRAYIVVYRPEQASEVEAIIGADMDDRAMWERSRATVRHQLANNASDAFGWFNLGSSLHMLRNDDDAAVAFDQARALGLPWRMLWYQFGPYETYLAVNRPDDMILLADVTLADNIYSEEAYFFKGQAYELEGKLQQARAQYETALQYNSHYLAARDALAKTQ